MGSLIGFYMLTGVWIALVGIAAFSFNEWRALSMRQALIYRLVGWITIFIALLRRLGFSDNSYRTLGGDSSIEAMDWWVFMLVVSVGLFCLFVAWISQYRWFERYGEVD